MAVTCPLWPVIVRCSLPSVGFQIRMPLRAPVARVAPSGEKTIDRMLPR